MLIDNKMRKILDFVIRESYPIKKHKIFNVTREECYRKIRCTSVIYYVNYKKYSIIFSLQSQADLSS